MTHWLRWMDFAEHTVSLLIRLAIALGPNKAISTIAGKTTIADVGVNLVTAIRISETVAYLLGALGIGYGLKQRKMRKRSIVVQSKRSTDLEAKLDPVRSSSELTETGATKMEGL